MIKNALGLFALLVISVSAIAQQQPAPASAQRPTPPHTSLKVGDKAPDFTLPATDGKTYKLGDYKGKKNVVLAFYVLAFTGG